MPGPDLWPVMYSDAYFEAYSVHHSSHAGYAAGKDVATKVANARLDRLRHYCASGRLLDVGCAGGHFLAAARARGYEVVGVEYSPSMVRYATDTYGLDVRQGDFLELEVPGPFDIVHMEDIIEHVADPWAVLRKVQDVLAPGGLVVIDGPLERQPNLSLALLELNLRMREADDPEMAPAHIWQFTLETQRRLLKRAGFVEERSWIYQERVPPLPPGDSTMQTLRRSVAGGVNALSAWISRQPALGFLQHGDRALVLYRRPPAVR